MLDCSMKIAIIGFMPKDTYSGGRYHAWIMAEALAAEGNSVYLISNCIPQFSADFEAYRGHKEIRFIQTTDYHGIQFVDGYLDYVICVPGIGMGTDFYYSCLNFAYKQGARLAFINFETPNWYEEYTSISRPYNDYQRLKELCQSGCMVISSCKESERYARLYYGDFGRVEHCVWSPPINSDTAESVGKIKKEKQVIAFVRPKDAHKGFDDIKGIIGEYLQGWSLVLVTGTSISKEERVKFEEACHDLGIQVSFKERLTDAEKFVELKKSQVLLFLSHFEGYGYPPIEALFCGTTCIAYDLPVLHETCGDALIYCGRGNIDDVRAKLQNEINTEAVSDKIVVASAEFYRQAEHLHKLLQDNLVNPKIRDFSARRKAIFEKVRHSVPAHDEGFPEILWPCLKHPEKITNRISLQDETWEKVAEKLQGKHIFLWGAGAAYRSLYPLHKTVLEDILPVLGLIDSDPQKIGKIDVVSGKLVIQSPDILASLPADDIAVIISNKDYVDEIVASLEEMAITNVHSLCMIEMNSVRTQLLQKRGKYNVNLAKLFVCRPFMPNIETKKLNCNFYFLDPSFIDVESMKEVGKAYGIICMENWIYQAYKEQLFSLEDRLIVVDDKVTVRNAESNSIRIAFFASSDTHVNAMRSISEAFPNHVYLIPSKKRKAEGASDALENMGETYIEIDFKMEKCQALIDYKPDIIFTNVDWTAAYLAVKRTAQMIGVPVVALQEGPEDWNFHFWENGNRLKCVNFYRDADIIFAEGAKTLNYIRPQYFSVTGNPKISCVEMLSLPKKPKVLINCNFTYPDFKPPYESQRQMWMESVLRACKKAGIDYIISRHPRDDSDWPGEPVIPSNAYKIRQQIEECSLCISRFSSILYEALSYGRTVVYYNVHLEPMPIFQDESNAAIQCVTEEDDLERLLEKHKLGYPSMLDEELVKSYLHRHVSMMDGKTTERIVSMIRETFMYHCVDVSELRYLFGQRSRMALPKEEDRLLKEGRNVVLLFDHEEIEEKEIESWIDFAEKLSDEGYKVFVVMRKYLAYFTSQMYKEMHQRIETILTRNYDIDFCRIPIHRAIVSKKLLGIEKYRENLRRAMQYAKTYEVVEQIGKKFVSNFLDARESGLQQKTNARREEMHHESEYVFPEVLFRQGDRVVLYGAGRIGREFYRQAKERGYVKIVDWVDPKLAKKEIDGKTVSSVDAIRNLHYDYVLIAYKDAVPAKAAQKVLASMGACPSSILWESRMYLRANFLQEAYLYLLNERREADSQHKKILMISIVPPFPDDQGNRVVTRNYMDFFVKKGYCIDAVMQSGYDARQVADFWGSSVRVYRTEARTKNSIDERIGAYKKSVRDKASDLMRYEADEYEKIILENLFLAANSTHPFSTISDQTVKQVERLLARCRYELILCNYVYSLRAIKELRKKFELPPVVTFTHDAVSRLGYQAMKYGLDVAERSCSKETEAACLAYSDIVCCISKYELEYFKEMGVRNCVLVEYDANEYFRQVIPNDNYEKKRIFFFASDNPLNEMGIHRFLEQSWPRILQVEPDCKLIIAGKICDKIRGMHNNLKLLGRLTRDEIVKNMMESTLAINPVFVGTGLKIKTVDMMSIGLPMVSYPIGIEGMEELSDKAFLVARNDQEFSKRILALLRDKSLWLMLREGARKCAEARFSKEHVYEELNCQLDRVLKSR